jgi:uncharacterized protein YrrD
MLAGLTSAWVVTMLQRAMDDLRGDEVAARDGRIGSVDDVYFDDQSWAVRYLVVDTGGWIRGRQVLIAAASVRSADSSAKSIAIELTRDEVEHSPGIECAKPVSRLYEEAHASYYGPSYWEGMATPALLPSLRPPVAREDGPQARELKDAECPARESHLRSAFEVVGYGIEAADGRVGHVEDFVVDDTDWSIRGIVVQRRLPAAAEALVPPSAVVGIDWDRRTVRVRLLKEQIARLLQ